MTKTQLNEMATEYATLNALQKQNEARLKILKQELQNAMDGCPSLILKDWILTQSTSTRTNADLDKLRADKLYDKYTKVGIVNHFQVNKK